MTREEFMRLASAYGVAEALKELERYNRENDPQASTKTLCDFVRAALAYNPAPPAAPGGEPMEEARCVCGFIHLCPGWSAPPVEEPRPVCTKCLGTGWDSGEDPCDKCETGARIPAPAVDAGTCPECKGKGWSWLYPVPAGGGNFKAGDCPVCAGTGRRAPGRTP